MRACTPRALSPHHTDLRCVGTLGNPEVPTIAPSQRHGPRALGTPYEAFPHPATQQLNHIFVARLAIRAAIKYDQDADGGWSGYRGEASTSSIRCPSSLSFHVMPLSSTGLPPFSSHEAVQFNQNALTYCQLPWAGTRSPSSIPSWDFVLPFPSGSPAPRAPRLSLERFVKSPVRPMPMFRTKDPWPHTLRCWLRALSAGCPGHE